MQRGRHRATSSHPLLGLLRLGLVAALAAFSLPRLAGASYCAGYDCWRVLPTWSGQQCAWFNPPYYGYMRIADVQHWVNGEFCPVAGLNSGHGQCSGYHQHGTSGEPMPAISPWNQWQQADANGMVCWNYNGNSVPQAGVYWMTMQSSDGVDIYEETWLIWVKIGAPSTGDVLTLLPSSTQWYVRIGALAGHNPGYSDAQDSNHWGTPTLASAATSLATRWKDQVVLSGGGCNGSSIPILRINDMSLELGGIYDYYNTWAPPHDKHREGRQVDISSARQNANGVPRSWEGEFCEIALGAGFRHVKLEAPPGNAPPLSPCEILYKSGVLIHWHLDLDP